MKKLLTIILLLTSFATMAASVQMTGLTEEQAATLQLKAAQMKAATKIPEVSTVESVSEWVEVANGLGTGINILVKELGVTANDFAKSPLGMFTTFLIAWTVIGKSLIGVTFGSLWVIFGTLAWLRMYRKTFVIESEVTYDKGREDKKLKEIKYRGKDNSPNETTFFYWLTLVLIEVSGFLVIFLT